MNLIQNRNSCFGKTLLMPDIPNCGVNDNESGEFHRNLPVTETDHVDLSAASVGNLTTNQLNVDQNLEAPMANLGGLQIFYDPTNKTTFIQNLSNNLVIKQGELPDTIKITEDGRMTIATNTRVLGNISGIEGIFSADVTADNAILLGNLVATNAILTQNLNLDGLITAGAGQIIAELNVGGPITSAGGIKTSHLNVDTVAKSVSVETQEVISPLDLTLSAGINRIVAAPNIRFNTELTGLSLITAEIMKLNKSFIARSNVILQADITCNGIEINIYNSLPTASIIVRDVTGIIVTLCARTACHLLYIQDQWVKL